MLVPGEGMMRRVEPPPVAMAWTYGWVVYDETGTLLAAFRELPHAEEFASQTRPANEQELEEAGDEGFACGLAEGHSDNAELAEGVAAILSDKRRLPVWARTALVEAMRKAGRSVE